MHWRLIIAAALLGGCGYDTRPYPGPSNVPHLRDRAAADAGAADASTLLGQAGGSAMGDAPGTSDAGSGGPPVADAGPEPDGAANADAGHEDAVDSGGDASNGPATDDGGAVEAGTRDASAPDVVPDAGWEDGIPPVCRTCKPAVQFCRVAADAPEGEGSPEGECIDCYPGYINCDGPWPISGCAEPVNTLREMQGYCDRGNDLDPGSWCCLMDDPPAATTAGGKTVSCGGGPEINLEPNWWCSL